MPQKPPLTPDAVQALKDHYTAIKQIQDAHGVTAKGSPCTWYPYGDDKLMVEADGLGGGTLMLVSDHYPFDGFDCRYSHHFEDEHEACRAAEWFDDLLENRKGDMSCREFFGLIEQGKRPWLEDETE